MPSLILSRKPFPSIRRLCLTYLCLSLLFSLGIVVANCIPTSLMTENLYTSADILQDEGGDYYYLMGKNEAWRVDNYTNAIMLNISGHGDNLGVVGAFGHYRRALTSDVSQVDTLKDSFGRAAERGYGWVDYARYWHGYTIFLKPMLLFLNINEIRSLIFCVCTALIGLNATLLSRLRGTDSGIAFVCAFIAIAYPVTCFSLSFSSSVLIALIASAFIIRRSCRHAYQPSILMFFIIGALTVYFDFLCNPILTLGIPLATTVFLKATSPEEDLSKISKIALRLFALCLAWLFGYALLWVTKWVLSSFFLQQNVVADGISQLLLRSGAPEDASYDTYSRAASLWRNIKLMLSPATVLIIIFTSSMAINHIARRQAISPTNLTGLFLLVLVSSLPYLWYLCTSNHSFYHFWFTYRNQAITILCIQFALLALFKRNDSPSPKEEPACP